MRQNAATGERGYRNKDVATDRMSRQLVCTTWPSFDNMADTSIITPQYVPSLRNMEKSQVIGAGVRDRIEGLSKAYSNYCCESWWAVNDLAQL